jgi:hypothetical protein
VPGKTCIAAILMLLLTAPALAADKLTKAQIQEVIDAADAASVQQDSAAIGAVLGSNFYKYIEVPSDGMPVTARINKQQYLDLIEQGWEKTSNYQYQRQDLVINLSPDGDTAESFATIIENFEIDGQKMVSKVREYARYELEDGRPVIVNIDSQTLVGDTTPEP